MLSREIITISLIIGARPWPRCASTLKPALVAGRSKPGMIGRRLIRKIARAKENRDG
jgi:hypothetical protein